MAEAPLIDDGGRPVKAYDRHTQPWGDWVLLSDYERLVDAARARILELERELERARINPDALA